MDAWLGVVALQGGRRAYSIGEVFLNVVRALTEKLR